MKTRGRPKLGPYLARTVQLKIVVTPAEMNDLRDRAAQSGQTISAYLRRAARIGKQAIKQKPATNCP